MENLTTSITNVIVPGYSFNDLQVGDQYAMGFVIKGSHRINIRSLSSLDSRSLAGYSRRIVVWEKTGKYSQEVILSDYTLVEIETTEYSYNLNHLKVFNKIKIDYEHLLSRS